MSRGLILPSVVAVGVLLVGSVGGLLDAPPATPSVGVPLALDPARVLDLARSGSFALDLPVVGRLAFDLQPNRIAEGAVIGLDGAPVGRVSETITFDGTANGDPVRLAATGAGVFLFVFDAVDPYYVEPLWVGKGEANLDPRQHRLVRWSEARPVIPGHPERVATIESLPVTASGPSPPANRVVHFLVESDFDLYQKSTLFGNCPTCWVDVQQAVMSIAEFHFENQTGISFNITSQWACTSPDACPYTAPHMSTLVDQFRDRWEAVLDEPAHELGHLLVGADLAGGCGVANSAVVNTPNGYADSKFAASAGCAPGSYVTTAHEIGHNFDAHHEYADQYTPALPNAVNWVGVFTIMKPGVIARLGFSDGTLHADKNNQARIVAHALQQLPP